MSLRRWVNAALTIQLFSQLFHFINMWLFNRLVAGPVGALLHYWGAILRQQLGHVEAWAGRAWSWRLTAT